jgi:toxin ParE1/3/4
MGLAIVWTRQAAAHVESIRLYIADFNGSASERIAQKLKRAGNSLAQQPERGRLIHGGMRELIVVSPYIIRYRVEPERVIILRIRHGARRPA